MASVRRYGIPETVESDMYLRFKVRAFGEVQSLFALDDEEGFPRLVGVVMFTRESAQSMLLIHIAIHQDYTYRGVNANAGVTARLLNAVCELSLRVRGVETLRMLYPHETQLVLREPRQPPEGRSTFVKAASTLI